MKRWRSIIALLLLGQWLQPLAFAQSLILYRWQPVDYAQGYIGVISYGSKKQRFLTHNLHVVLPEDVRLRRIHPVNVKHWRTNLPTSKLRVKLVSFAKADQSQASKPKVQTTGLPEPNHQEAAINPWPESPPSVKNLNQYDLSLGLGREQITAQALGSEFRAEALIANTAVRVLHQPDLSRWSFDGQISAHYFNAKFEESQAVETSNPSSTRIFRWMAEGIAFYDFFYRKKAQLLALGLGLHTVRLPSLETAASDTQSPGLASQTMVAPLAGIQYVWLTARKFAFGGRFVGQPIALSGGLRGIGYQASLFIAYRMTEQWGGILTAQQSQYRYTIERNCVDLNDCKSRDPATDSSNQITLGVTYHPH